MSEALNTHAGIIASINDAMAAANGKVPDFSDVKNHLGRINVQQLQGTLSRFHITATDGKTYDLMKPDTLPAGLRLENNAVLALEYKLNTPYEKYQASVFANINHNDIMTTHVGVKTSENAAAYPTRSQHTFYMQPTRDLSQNIGAIGQELFYEMHRNSDMHVAPYLLPEGTPFKGPALDIRYDGHHDDIAGPPLGGKHGGDLTRS